MGKKIIKEVKNIFSAVLDIIYPADDKCIMCNAEDFIGICPLCKSNIKRIQTQEEILSYGFYGGILKELILAFKYDKNFTAGDILVDLLLSLIEEEKVDGDYICYVPMTKRSMKKRGFNQCEVIAEKIGDKLNIPVSKCLIKNKNTKEQKTLSKEERMKNIEGVFDIKNKSKIYNKKVILIDDVVTTGATLLECKKLLEKNAVEKITILTIAKSYI